MKILNMIVSTLVLSTLFFSCDKNEFAPEMADQEFTIAENSPVGTIIGIVNASDGDEGQQLSFEITDGNEDGAFSIDPQSGTLSVADSTCFDFELNEQLTILVQVNDDHSQSMSATASITVSITDVFEQPAGLVAYYPFDGNAIDASGYGNDGIVHGAELTTDRKGLVNSAYYFDGNLSYIDLGNAVELKRYLSDYTVAGWIKLDEFSPTYNSMLMSNRNPNTTLKSGSYIGIGGLLSSLSKKMEYVQNYSVTGDEYTYDYLGSSTELDLGDWYFFCITYEYKGNLSNTVKIYINGVFESQKLMGEVLDPENENTFLGCEPQLAPIEYSFIGCMDEIQIYNRALSDVEIMTLYNK
ncbi:MAG: LamG-like jellyroll fold domain-containing protein [Bacteroidota bacterium]|nr:LamG-like jellyroll fold domain-containing protein [Bacteroidota bacterium]